MSIRLEDIKERTFSIAKEFRGQRMGMVGLSIIIFMLILAILAPWLAPDVDGEWASMTRWADNPRSAEPVWVDYILPGSRASHEIREDPDEFDEGRMELFYNYDNDYDYPVSDVSVRVEGKSDRPEVRMWYDITRPDGTVLEFYTGERVSVSEEFQFVERGDEIFTFELDQFAIEGYMQEGPASESLRRAFLRYGIQLTGQAEVTEVEEGFWHVDDGIYRYEIEDPDVGLYLEVAPRVDESFQLPSEVEDDLNEDYIHENVSAAFWDVNAELSAHANISAVDEGWLIEDGIFSFTIDEDLVVHIDIAVGDDLFEFDMTEILHILYFDTVGTQLERAFSNNGFELSDYANITEIDEGWLVDDGEFEFRLRESEIVEYGIVVEVDIKDGVLFTLDEELEEYLPEEEEESVHDNVTAAFEENGILLTRGATINVTDEGWVIQDGAFLYEIDEGLAVEVRMLSFDIDVTPAELNEDPIHDNVTAAFEENGITLSGDATINVTEEGWEIRDEIYIFSIDGDMNVESSVIEEFRFGLNVNLGLEYAFEENEIYLPTRAEIHEPDYARWQIDDRAFNYTIVEIQDGLFTVNLRMRDIFRFDLDYEFFLEVGDVSAVLRELFEGEGIDLSPQAEILDHEDSFWKILDGDQRTDDRYFIEDRGDLIGAIHHLVPEEFVEFSDRRGATSSANVSLIEAFRDNIGIDIDSNREIITQWDDEGTVWWVDDEGGYMIRLEADGLNILSLEDFSFVYNFRSTEGRNVLYDFGLDYHEAEEVPGLAQINIERVPFAKSNENIFLNPEPLKGEYVLRLRPLYATELNHEATRVIFRGRKYGLMGTDNYRRDIALGWVWGARWALLIGAIVSISTVSLALLYGMTSAYYGGWVDEFMQRLNEVLIGIPMFPILIITMFILGRSIWIFIAIYTILGWRGLAKIIRSRGIQIRQDTYIEAAQSLGSSGGRVITRHMIPQLLPYAIAEGALMIPLVIIAEAGLSVLGLGDPNVVTWGRMLSQAHENAATTAGWWWWVLLPGLGITLVGFAFISTGMALERVINPKMRQR